MNILLVHGMFSSGTEFPRLFSVLQSDGHHCFIPKLKPYDANKGIKDLSNKLAAYIEAELPPRQKFVIVGFSMGCVISRYYIQHIDRENRVTAFFSICGPHYGSYLAYLYLGKGARDLRPGSRFLKKLNAYGGKFKRIPTYSYRLKFDHMVIPACSSDWGCSQSLVVSGVFHADVPFNDFVIADISQHLLRLENRSSESHDANALLSN